MCRQANVFRRNWPPGDLFHSPRVLCDIASAGNRRLQGSKATSAKELHLPHGNKLLGNQRAGMRSGRASPCDEDRRKVGGARWSTFRPALGGNQQTAALFRSRQAPPGESSSPMSKPSLGGRSTETIAASHRVDCSKVVSASD